MRKIKWGVIGAGGFADRRSIPALKEAHNSEIVALMVRTEEKAKALAEKHGVPKFYTRVEDLLKDKEVEAVYIATPVYLHKEHVIEAANAGKHILCEKPMALNVKEGEEMIRECQKLGVKLMVAYMKRFHSYHQKIKQMIENRELGKVILTRIQTHLQYPPQPGAWRQDPSKGGGGPLMDVGSHCIDLAIYFLGEVEEVTALVGNLSFDYPVEDTSTVILKFKEGAHALIDASFSIPYYEGRVEVYGTERTVLCRKTMGPFTEPEMKLIDEEGERIVEVPPNNPYKEEFEHFADCILQDRQPAIDGEEGLKSLRIIQAAYRSSKEGRRVKI